jgi:GlpG protein
MRIHDIDALAEESDGAWQVWVRDEDKTEHARAEFEKFSADRSNPRYANSVAEAESRAQAEAARRIEAQRQTVKLSDKWQRQGTRVGPSGPRPVFVVTVIAVSILATVLTGMGPTAGSGRAPGLASEVFDGLAFVGTDALRADKSPMASINRGEIWRLITPIFLHMTFQHILFNCLMFYIMGRQIEWERGPYFLALFVLVVGLAANLGQALVPTLVGHYQPFGGLSGVIYGIFGYLWICSRTGQGRYFMPDFVVFVMLAWFVVCWLGELKVVDNLDNIANWNHTFGLLAGITWAMRGAKN